MSDPNEDDATLIKQPIEPHKTQQNFKNGQKDDKKIEKNQSDVRSSINRSRSDDSLKNDVNLADSIVGDDVGAKIQQDAINLIPEDFFYSDLQVNQFQVISDSPINQNVAKLDFLYGHDSFKNYNAHILDRDTIIYASGISYTIYNHFTREKTIFYSKGRGGIGAIAVHPQRKFFAVAQKGVWPNIYIYQYPGFKLYRVIRKGTERSYSCINFSGDGQMLASVGSDPDYLLTVWQWKQQRMILKSKAFSQEVYRVNFSQFNQKWITTSGTGHIRFWRIASTFTGMKLKGDIAKFGQFQISDVVSFAEFEDSNVISSSQYGKLLVWEGNLIRSVVMIDKDTPCHKGKIQFVKLLKNKDNRLITAGSDGYIKFWDGIGINTGQSDQYFNFYIKPEKQIYFEGPFGGPAHLIWIDIDDELWIVQDAKGRTWKYQPSTDTRTQILRYNSGMITDFSLSPLNNCLVTTGQDGIVRLWDYGSQRQFYNKSFPNQSKATCLQWLPFSKKNNGRMIVVGFSDGIVRFLFLDPKGFTLVKVFKVHKTGITKIKSNRDGTIIVACDTAGSLFFLSLDSPVLTKVTPFCLFETGYKINDLTWDRNGEKILLACNDGRLHQVFVPKQKQCDYSETYLRKFQSRTFTIKMMESQKPNREQLQLELMLKKTKGLQVDQSVLDVQWEPAPILNAIYYDMDCTRVLCSVEGKYLGYFYIVDFNKQRPIGSIEVSKTKTSYLGFSESHDLIFIGFRNGVWQVRNKHNPNYYLKKTCFDQDYGVIRKVGLNIENTAILSASQDGTLLCHKFDFESFKKGVRGDSVENVQISIPNVILGISAATFGDPIDLSKQKIQQITDNTIYSLQDEKLKAEQDTKMTQAEKVKAKKIKKVKELQQMFKEIIEANNNQKDNLIKLTPEELLVDPQYTASYQKRMDQQQEETRKVLEWDQYKSELAKKKLEDYVINELEYKKFSVKGILTNVLVSSFKLKKLSPYVLSELGKIQKILKEEEDIAQRRLDKKSRTSSSFTNSKSILEIGKQKQIRKGGKEENHEVRNKIREAQAQFEKQLAHAIATKGDYKLKCSPDYVVPENQRLNVSRKKKHLFLHYQYLFLEKKEFNDRLFTLRKRKQQIIDKLSGVNKTISLINKKLNIEEKQLVIELDEQLEEMQAEIEINEEDIEEYLVQKQRQKQASKKTGGMGMGGSAPPDSNNDANKNEQKKKKVPKKVVKVAKEEESQSLSIKTRPNQKIKKSDLQNEVKQIEQIKLLAEKQKIKKDLQKEIGNFDEELKQLRTLKKTLQNDLTLVQMKILTYAQQFIIFRDMETDDNDLMQQLNVFGQQKQKHQDNFMKLSSQIGEIETVLQQLKKKHEDEKKILKEFVYPEDDDMREKILRYYKIRERKRIYKLKKQAEQQQKQKLENKQDEEEDEDEDQQQEQESQQSEDEFQDEDEKPDITVIENDHKNFERVRKICQYDQKIEENAKKKSDLERQRTQITKEIRNLDIKLENAENSLKEYQKKKLLKTNQLIVSYPIKFSQVEYILKTGDKFRLYEQFNQAILFTNKQFERLSRRIEQLVSEKVDIEKKQKVLKKKEVKLKQTVEKASQQIDSKRKEYEQKQLLKFGRTFQLDKLKDLQPNDQVLEARDLYKKQERQISNKIQHIKEQLQQRKRQLLQAKKQNTKVITDITDLGEKQNELKKKLDSTNKQLFKNYDASKKDELQKQRQNLKDLIKFLSKQIEDLKTEIGLFKRKGGHIYTMVTSNKKNFS